MTRPALLALAAAAALAAAPAHALRIDTNTDLDGYALAGGTLFISSLSASGALFADTTMPVLSGQIFADGQTVPGVVFPSGLGMENVAQTNQFAGATVSGSAFTVDPVGPGGQPALLTGSVAAEANRSTGTLRLAAQTSSVQYPVQSPSGTLTRQTGSYALAAAEIKQNFEVRIDDPNATAPFITLSLKLQGTLQSAPDFGWANGLRASVQLTNIPGPNGSIADSYRDFEMAVIDDTLTLSGQLQSFQCSATRGFCESFFGVTGRIEIYARSGDQTSLDTFGGRFGGNTQLDFWNTAQMTVTTSPGVSVFRGADIGGSYEWVNPTSPVPEPASAALLAAGFALLAGRLRRRHG